MSLLMDALKRAEQANQQGQTSQQPEQTSHLALEAVPADESLPNELPVEQSSAATLPELQKLEALDDEFLAHVKQPTPKSRPTVSLRAEAQKGSNQRPQQQGGGSAANAKPATPEAAAMRETVRNAFSIKQTAATGRPFLLIVGVATAIAVAAMGIYFWAQLRPSQGIAAKSPIAAGPAQTAPTPLPPSAISPESIVPPTRSVSPAQPPRNEPLKAAAMPAAASPRILEQIQPRIDAGMEPIQISRSRPKTEPAVDEGYRAFQAGNVAAAKSAYARLLDRDPRNLDALRGVAAIALHEGRIEDAETAYLRILDIDPRDAIANAGLLGIRNDGDPVAGEGRMKNLLTTQPDMHILHFSLGNLYARQSRWSEAQQAYFKAYGADSDNPDYLFNLAVSLDQLHQPKLARQYYEQALKAAENRPAAFDRNQATARVHDLRH